MKTLTLIRPNNPKSGEGKIAVYLNGKIAARLKDGEKKEIRLSDESIVLQAKFLKWFGSEKQMFSIKENTNIEVVTLPNRYNQSVFVLSPMIVAISSLFYNHQTWLFFATLLLGIGLFIHGFVLRRNSWFSFSIK